MTDALDPLPVDALAERQGECLLARQLVGELELIDCVGQHRKRIERAIAPPNGNHDKGVWNVASGRKASLRRAISQASIAVR